MQKPGAERNASTDQLLDSRILPQQIIGTVTYRQNDRETG